MTKVLILDDRPADRQLLSTVLDYAGHEVVAAEDGAIALDLARREKPDLIISDVLMPGMNGYEFVRRLRAEPDVGATTVIFCTGTYEEGEVRRLAASVGVTRFLPKPYEPQSLMATVKEALGDREVGATEVEPLEFDREQLRIVNNKLVEKVTELEAVSAERQHLAVQLMQAYEDERQRIAQAIHDDQVQALVAVGMRLELLSTEIEDEAMRGPLGRIRDEVTEAMERLRNLVFELEPVGLRREGLAPALRAYLDETREEGLEYELSEAFVSEPSEPLRVLLYRIAQEILMNVRKHAHASRVEVALEQEFSAYVMRISDDGQGFDPEKAMQPQPGHLGLTSTRERIHLASGSLAVKSRPGSGTTVEVWLPEPDASNEGSA